jgi:hypothetical protein
MDCNGRRRLFGGACMVVVSLLVACGGSKGSGNPAQPSPPPAPAGPPSWTFRGAIAETLSGAPVEGATVTFALAGGATSVTTAPGGQWELTRATSEGQIAVTVAAPGYVERLVHLRPPGGTREVAIDLIKDTAPFSMSFYRQLVRNAWEEPEDLQPIRRWTSNPNFYVNTYNPRTGGPVPASELESLTRIIRAAVPMFTGGTLEAGAIETGTETDRRARTGEIQVRFIHDPKADHCGTATVGGNPGEIILNYGVDGCQSTCGPFAPRTVAHEIGHAMGFWHVEQGAVLNTVWFNRDCAVTNASEAERHHARVAYTRPRGNVDPDSDHASSPMLHDGDGPPPVLRCR